MTGSVTEQFRATFGLAEVTPAPEPAPLPPYGTHARQMAERVLKIVVERGRYYDHPAANFQRIAERLTPMLGRPGRAIDVVEAMLGTKIARERYRLDPTLTEAEQADRLLAFTDNLDDIVGYIFALVTAYAHLAGLESAGEPGERL